MANAKAITTADVSDAMLALGACHGSPAACAEALAVALARLVSRGFADKARMVEIVQCLGTPERRVLQ